MDSGGWGRILSVLAMREVMAWKIRSGEDVVH